MLKLPCVDERKADRLPLALSLTYVIMDPTGARMEGETKTIDIGGGGVRFAIPNHITLPATCHVRLSVPSQREPLQMTGQIAWSHPRCGKDPVRWEIGVAFCWTDGRNEVAFARYSRFIASQLLALHLR